MYIIPAIRTTRVLCACTLLPNNPLIAIASSEIISVVCPFIKNSTFKTDIIVFMFYFFYNNDHALKLIEKYKNKDIIYYNYELLSSLIFLLFYYKIELF